jgi:alcohol dehydrogenase class IV
MPPWRGRPLSAEGTHHPRRLADTLKRYDVESENGIGGVGSTEADVPDLVPGTVKQQRLLATCPRTPSEDDIAGILTQSVENW